MNRDGSTYDEAKNEVKFTLEMVQDAINNGCYCEAEEIFMNELGLEIDYLINLLLGI